jgi:ribonucleases P/MRP protein subunit RPP40
LWTSEERRNRADLIELFKIHRHESAIEIMDMSQPAAETRTRGHTRKLQKNICRLDLRKYFFSECVVDRWNALDQKTVESGTLNMFKNRLNVIRMDKMGFITDA